MPVAGRLWLAGKHRVGPDPEGAMAQVAAELIVCLCEPHELSGRYPDYVGWLHAEVGRRALWHPVPDLHAPPLAEARHLLAGVARRLEEGQVVLVHCGAGIGRAGTLACGLLVGWGVALDEAVAHVAAHRPLAGPEAGAQAELLATLADDDGR